MDSVFLQTPLFLLFIGGAAVLHIVSFLLRNRTCRIFAVLANIALHSAALCVILTSGGTNEDALLFLLLSACAALLQCKKPRCGDAPKKQDAPGKTGEDGGARG